MHLLYNKSVFNKLLIILHTKIMNILVNNRYTVYTQYNKVYMYKV